ncbi:MAG: hypothetical protein V1736_09775 [Pseudomonadota bacterium]
MSERFSELENSLKGKKSLEERLNAQPLLRDRIEMLLRVVENAAGDVEKADEAERLVIEEIRQMGNTALRSWAENQHRKKVEEFEKSKEGCRRRKKNSTGTVCSEK